MLTREPESFEALLRGYLDELELHRFSRSSREHARRALTFLFQYLTENGVQDIREVHEERLLGFVHALRELKGARGKPLSPGTQSTYVSAMRRFFTHLDKRSILLRNPAAHIRLPQASRLPRFVPSQEQMEKLLEMPPADCAVGIRDRAILEVFYGTGIRMGECRSLNVEDIDLQKATLWVRVGKGLKDRLLPIPGKTLRALELYMRLARPALLHDPKQPALFLSRVGARLSVAMLNVMIRAYGHAAGFTRPLHAHAIRHACATHLLVLSLT